ADTVTADPAGDVDLVREGATLHLAIALVSGIGRPTGIAYAASANDGPWSVETVDTGNDVTPRLAVDAGGHAHLSYLRATPEHEIRYATNASGDWATQLVDAGSNWGRPAFGVDAAGIRHVAVGRTGEDPGVWYGTDTGGHWTLARLTDEAPDGRIGLAVAPDGSASIAFAEFFAADGTPLPDRAVRVMTGRPGAWTTTRIADDTGDASPAIARDAAGHLHLAFGFNAGGLDRLDYATNGSGAWVVTPATPGDTGHADRHPSIAVDAAGKVHVAFERSTDDPLPDGTVSIGYATNASSTWTASTVSSGPEYRLDPSIALDASGKPRVAYGIDNGDGSLGSAGGVRLATFNGATWATATISGSSLDGRPSLAIDTLGRSHVLYARDAPYSICTVPLCASAPGLWHWTDLPGFGAPRRVTDNADDTWPSIVRGPDGSVSGAFVDVDWRLADIRLMRPLPTATVPAVHLSGAGTTLAHGRATIVANLGGSGATTFRLQESVNGHAFATIGPVTGATSRLVSLAPGSTTTRRYRVIPTDVYGRTGSAVDSATFRVTLKSEAKTSTLTYKGRWSTSTGSSYLGGRVRRATSSAARVSYRFTGRELTWVAAKGRTRGKARVYVDGVLVSTLDLHAGSTAYRRVVFRKAWTASGTHTITIRPVGNGRVDVDGFEVLR
ncbi:MAG TPA: hypothetical protein VGM28_06225, partial [Candidatus Limnocylindrales bacterium]